MLQRTTDKEDQSQKKENQETTRNKSNNSNNDNVQTLKFGSLDVQTEEINRRIAESQQDWVEGKALHPDRPTIKVVDGSGDR